MQEQQHPPMRDSSSENTKHSTMVPYGRFAEVNKQLKEARAELAALKLQAQEEKPSGEQPSYTVEEIFKRLMEDPAGYLKEIMSEVMQDELQMLREEIELKSALKHARQKYPEFQSFENYIIQELMNVVEDDQDIVKLSWDEILDKGLERVQAKFKSAVQQAPGQVGSHTGNEVQQAYVEGTAARKPQPVMPVFTRNEIEKMSLEEFLKNEEAINTALKNNLIR